MKIIQVRVSRKFNLGNYESCEVGAVAEPETGENFETVAKELDRLVQSRRPGVKP